MTWVRSGVWCICCVVLMTASGCGSDHWTFFEVDWDRAMSHADRQRIETEPRVLPPEEAPEFPDSTDDPTQPLELSLEQAVVSSLRYNRSLSVEQLNPPIAGTFIAQEQAVYDPTVFAEAFVSAEDDV